MNAGYVDTSCLVAVAFGEPGSDKVRSRLGTFADLYASNLLEAELRSALVREGADDDPGSLLTWITWVLPDRPLGPEIGRVLARGYVRGADLWHLATALYLVEDPSDLPFLTLDLRQREIAGSLGFQTPP